MSAWTGDYVPPRRGGARRRLRGFAAWFRANVYDPTPTRETA